MIGTSPSILITDDDRDFRETLGGVFEHQGFRTLLAGDGDEALCIVRQQEVHLVLLDMHMPRLTGLETLRLVKQVKSRLPCILLSAGANALLAHQAMRADAFLLLAKPVSRKAITGSVRMALRRTYNWPDDCTDEQEPSLEDLGIGPWPLPDGWPLSDR